MRDSSKYGLIASALLLALGLGWYWQHPGEVHDWVRSLGRTSLAADEVIVRQRTTATLPGLDGTVKVRVGDIERGRTADVEIIGPDSATLASKKRAEVGDRIAFTHGGKNFEVEIIRYFDEIGPGDSARFRILPLENDNPAPAEKNKGGIEGAWRIERAGQAPE